MAFWKESMINRLSNLINRNRSAAKISQVLCSNKYTTDTNTNLSSSLAQKYCEWVVRVTRGHLFTRPAKKLNKHCNAPWSCFNLCEVTFYI